MKDKVIIIAEHLQGKINPAVYELITFAENLCSGKRENVELVIPGKEIKGIAETLARDSGLPVTGIENSALEFYNTECYIEILAEFLSQREFDYICTLHTSTGFDFTPALALKLKTPCITGVEKLSTDNNGSPVFTRSLFNSKLKMDITSENDVSLITVQPGSFKAPEREIPSKPGVYEIFESDYSPQRIKSTGIIRAEPDDYPITEAAIIVSAGKGIGKEENLNLIRQLADMFPHSAIGSSRILCDLGWLDYRHQVGTTGKTVSPKLYIACGISGTVQHVSGMKGSNIVVAINNDPMAAIFNIADYCVVEDLTKFIPVFIDIFRKYKSS